jgi:predicted SAM-dependent methyltransferase
MKIHIGCGGKKLEGYVNVDVRAVVKPDQVVDITAGWPWCSDTVDEVASYHVLEHLTKQEALHVMRETLRVLKTGGKVVIECPNAKQTAREFAAGNDYRINNLYGLQRNPFDFHRYGYWPTQMQRDMPVWGFTITHLGPGTDYHATQEPCMRVEAVKA